MKTGIIVHKGVEHEITKVLEYFSQVYIETVPGNGYELSAFRNEIEVMVNGGTIDEVLRLAAERVLDT